MDNPNNLTVELRPSIGIYAAQFGDKAVEVEQENPFFEVWVGGRVIEMGYGHTFVRAGLCAKDGKWMNWESHAVKWGKAAIDYAASEVQRLTKADNLPKVLVPQNPVVNVEDVDEVIDVSDLDEIVD